jgi:Tfp pilus assembly protein PilV
MLKLSDMWISTEVSKQRGASALEASLAMVPVLLVCLLGVELVHVHQVKQLASLALQEAGRVASVTGANHTQVNRAFAQALAPRFATAGRAANAADRQDATLVRYRKTYALPLWQLKLTDMKGLSAQPEAFQAVRLDLIYLHEPLQPWLRHILKQSIRWLSASPNGLIVQAQQQGLVVMRLSRKAVIHSNGVQQRPKSLPEDIPQQLQQDMSEQLALNTQQELNAWQPLAQGPQPTPTLQNVRMTVPFSQRSDSEGKTVQKEDLCGVLLCCAP